METTIFAPTWRISDDHEGYVRALWKISGVWMAAMGAAVIGMSLLGRLPDVSPAYGVAALALGLLAVYIGFKKTVPARISVIATRIVGLAAAVLVFASLAGYGGIAGAAQVAAVAGIGGVALYVGFFPR